MSMVFDRNNHDICHILYCAQAPRFYLKAIVQCTVQLEGCAFQIIEHHATALPTWAFGGSGGRLKKQAKQGQEQGRASLVRSTFHSVASTFLADSVKINRIPQRLAPPQLRKVCSDALAVSSRQVTKSTQAWPFGRRTDSHGTFRKRYPCPRIL